MKLNREEIIKSLERCGCVGIPLHDCKSCHYNAVEYCRHKMAQDCLTLIKELTEENDRLRFVPTHICVGDVITSEQMEELRTAHTLLGMHGDPVGERGECGLKRDCVADTVQKMQEKIRAKSEYGTINMSSWQLDQIVKEMLEENK